MKVTVNGKPKTLKEGATLKQAVAGEHYIEGSDISIHLSTEKVTEVSNDFALMTPRGEMVVHLYDTDDAKRFRASVENIKGVNLRWSTNEIAAFGSFPSDMSQSDEEGDYKRYDVFFALGGNDNQTTYVMVAKRAFRKAYGCGTGKIGKITVGRHLLAALDEGERIVDVHPVISETSQENVVITKDLGYKLADGYSIDTNILVKLNPASPMSAEQVLILSSKGYFNVSEGTGTFMGCRDDMDVDMEPEETGVRDVGTVTVRNSGVGKGHVMLYKERRQLSPAINVAGTVERGMALASRASAGDKVAITTDPQRILSVGMTQAEGQRFLESFGLRQKRSGDLSDDAIIADQTPEATMSALAAGEIETFGVPKEKILKVKVTTEDERTAHYFRKVTGLSHKPIGQLKVQFSFPGMSMVTFYGDDARGQDLYPQEPFKKCKKGDLGVTNQSRPHHGLIGIRLTDSKEFGPTGEEPYGTNMIGRYDDDMGKLDELEDEQTVYITEDKL